jgi:hypothetical protein
MADEDKATPAPEEKTPSNPISDNSDADSGDWRAAILRRIDQRRLDITLKELEIELAELQNKLAELSAGSCESQPKGSIPKAEPDYSTLVRLAEHAQQNKWQTLQMFVLFQSLLFVGWVNLYKDSNDTRWGTRLILFAITMIGVVTGVIWRRLGQDYSGASDLYDETVRAYEELPGRIPVEFRVFTHEANR